MTSPAPSLQASSAALLLQADFHQVLRRLKGNQTHNDESVALEYANCFLPPFLKGRHASQAKFCQGQ